MNPRLIAAACAACIGCQATAPAPARTEEPTPVVIAAAPPMMASQPSALPDPNGPAPELSATSPQYATPGNSTLAAVRQQGNKLKLPAPVMFQVGRAALKPESEPVLAALREFLDSKPQITLVRIEGHTDSQGNSAANLSLSGQRALALREWLITHGLSPSRAVAVGFGEMKPIADNQTAEGRALNRRMEFVVVEVNGAPWLGADPIGGGTVFGPNPR